MNFSFIVLNVFFFVCTWDSNNLINHKNWPIDHTDYWWIIWRRRCAQSSLRRLVISVCEYPFLSYCFHIRYFPFYFRFFGLVRIVAKIRAFHRTGYETKDLSNKLFKLCLVNRPLMLMLLLMPIYGILQSLRFSVCMFWHASHPAASALNSINIDHCEHFWFVKN